MRIAESFTIPSDAVTQTFACIGRKGAGKTYLATALAEQMLDAKAQIVVLDPVGNWWGLRVAADGRGKGKDIFVAGGERGDVPILPDSGARFARVVVEKGVSIVLDVSSFRQGERKRFAADFAEEFFHLKKSQRSAVHLFVEEAQLFAPQRVGPDEARMLGAFENIIRLGRNYGIGATMISQRPQSINKEVLSQVECLCVLQVNGTHERKALEEWVQEAGADRKLVGMLPGLGRGEGFVWSPSWLRKFERVKFVKKTTFDASATPEVGKQAKAAQLAPADIEALKADIQEVIAKAKQDDPKELRRRIAELERATKTVNAPDPKAMRDLEERVEAADLRAAQLSRKLDELARCASLLRGVADELDAKPNLPVRADAMRAPVSMRTFAPSRPVVAPSSNGNLRAGARRMLGVLCQWSPAGRTESQLAAQVQMKKTGGTWGTYKSDLKNGGYIEVRGDGLWYATQAGLDFMGTETAGAPATTEEVVALWGPKLRKGAREMLDVLVRRRGRLMSREELGEQVNMEPSGGTFGTYLSDLRQAGLIVVDRDGVRANEETLLL